MWIIFHFSLAVTKWSERSGDLISVIAHHMAMFLDSNIATQLVATQTSGDIWISFAFIMIMVMCSLEMTQEGAEWFGGGIRRDMNLLLIFRLSQVAFCVFFFIRLSTKWWKFNFLLWNSINPPSHTTSDVDVVKEKALWLFWHMMWTKKRREEKS